MIEVSDPKTEELFGKENIRQVVREWVLEFNTNKWNTTEEEIEENIERFERVYMESLRRFVNDSRILCTSSYYYKRFLLGEVNQEYIEILQKEVKRLFLETFLDKPLSMGSHYRKYICLKTIKGKFYRGEIYKCFEEIHFFMNRSKYGRKEEGVKFHLVPEKGAEHLTIDKNLEKNFKKI